MLSQDLTDGTRARMVTTILPDTVSLPGRLDGLNPVHERIFSCEALP